MGSRPRVAGKFLWAGEEKLLVRGVTYGTFRPDSSGAEFHDRGRVAADLDAMAAAGVNAVRVYTPPPGWLLDQAAERDLRVMVGLPWEQHVAFLDDRSRAGSIERRVREGVRALAGHPGLLCYAVGNEIPSPIVRWHGRPKVQAFLERLVQAVKSEDPAGLVTYVNYPSTEYLELRSVDLVSFNVYLESRNTLEAYLARLHNLAGDRPLLMAEIGLDSRRNGEAAQASTLAWQLETIFSAGCAGTFVFSWTDEWYRGGCDILDWDFGLTRRDRSPKPALGVVQSRFTGRSLTSLPSLPRISVCICTRNGSRTIGRCLEGARGLDYSNYEIVVVDDGSTDATAEIARSHGVRVISTPGQGLSAARNTAMEASDGEILAYLDDDAWPDPDWLTHLAYTFTSSEHAAVGGPNLTPADASAMAQCVGEAPGGPQHVLLDDALAEHVPGCNMAIRKRELRAIGGFDPRFVAAGDDVDVCWRLLDAGRTIGFNGAAMVWHKPRSSVRAFWRQQRGYGRAEALLERKWPERYTGAGSARWQGRLYGTDRLRLPSRGWRVYYGQWGSGLFQSIYQPAAGRLEALTHMPEWYLLLAALALVSLLGLEFSPLLLALPPLAAASLAVLAPAIRAARRAQFPSAPRSRLARLWLRVVLTGLHVAQPLARLHGRLRGGLTPWRATRGRRWHLPLARTIVHWSEDWHASEQRLSGIHRRLLVEGATVRLGGDYDRWDLHVIRGALGGARLRMVVEEHGGGRQLARYRVAPVPAVGALVVAVLLTVAAVIALASDAVITATALSAAAITLMTGAARACGSALGVLRHVLRSPPEQHQPGASRIEPAGGMIRDASQPVHAMSSRAGQDI